MFAKILLLSGFLAIALSAPADGPSEITDKPGKPTDKPVLPIVIPVKSTNKSVKPTDIPVQPTDIPVESSNKPVEPVPIVDQQSDIQANGTFKWNFESGDGTKQEQAGSVKTDVNKEEAPGPSVQGTASWTDPEGKKHELTYVADENGFQPKGVDIPVPPAIPAPIARALEWIAAHPEPEEKSASPK